jgi:protein transport protein SEC24
LQIGALKPREDVKLLGTAKENSLLQPESGFYKNFAVDCSRTQVTIDMFLFGGQYIDLTTLSTCFPPQCHFSGMEVLLTVCRASGGACRYTAGSSYYYPGFNASREEDVTKFASELGHFLGRAVGLEAVLRIRASKGIRISAFHGNFFVRSTDLLALATVSPDNAYAIQLTIEENLESSMACFQTAVLHTASFGERRIRVVTAAYPVTSSLGEMYQNIDAPAMTNLLAKMGKGILERHIEGLCFALLIFVCCSC